MKRLKHHFIYSLVCGLVFTSAACTTQSETQLVILATSTSVSNSGLLDVLLPAFEQVSGTRIDGHLVGSGLALQMLDREQADLVISHAPTMEASFLAKHPEWSYKKLMYNQFLLVGPLDDPANVLAAQSLEAAIQQIVQHEARFVSRGDESGTHTREQDLKQELNRNSCALQPHLLGDQFLHDLIGTAANRQDLAIPVKPLYDGFTHVPHAAVNLNGLAGDFLAHLHRKVLRHGNLLNLSLIHI